MPVIRKFNRIEMFAIFIIPNRLAQSIENQHRNHRMYSLLLRRFNIMHAEGPFSILMFITAGFLGIFLSSFDIAAHAIFLDQLDQKDLALAYLASGILGMVIFSIYAQVFKRLKAKSFYFINSTIILAITLAYFYFYLFNTQLWSAFLGLVVMFPVNLLALLNFWRYLTKMVQPAQARRIRPFIELGFILGAIGGSFLVIIILRNFDYYIIPLMTLVAMAMMFIMQMIINPVHKSAGVFNYKRDKYVPVKRAFLLIFSSRYTVYLFLFAMLSSAVGFLIHFSFINLSRESFPHIIGMSKFYGLFIGVMFIFILFSQKLLIRRILYSYDSPYSLVLMPVAIFLMLLATFGIGLITRRLEAFDRFTFIFLLVAMNKIAYESTHYLIQVPSMRTLYRTLDIRFLQVIIPRIEGNVVMLGMLLAGGVILGILHLPLSPIMGVLFAATLLTPLWLFFGIKLVKGYRAALQDTYKRLRISAKSTFSTSETYTEKIRRILVGDDPVKVINAMHISSRIEPLEYERSLQRMLANPNPEIQSYVLECIERESIIELLPDLKALQPASAESEEKLSRIIDNFENKVGVMDKGVDLEELVSSRKVKDRLFAAEVIGARRDQTYTSALVNLSREFEPDVKVAAVRAMARMSNPDHSYILIEFLNSAEFHAYAFEALVQIGDPAVEYLERLFLNPNTSDKLLTRVIRIYGKIGSAKTIDLLLNKLENQSRAVTLAAISALHEANFQASSLNVHRILKNVVRTINVLGWNFLIFTSLPKKKRYFELRMAFSEEIEMEYDMLYNLLSLAYNARTLREIRGLLDHGDTADISHAVEMLDHFVYEDIKQVLFPVIENIKPEERVKQLRYYFPLEEMTEEEMISFTLTRDYNLLSIYPRVCAMQLALDLEDFEISSELLANMFHPNKLIREVAGIVTQKMDSRAFSEVLERLDPEIQHEMADTISAYAHNDRLLLVERFRILKNVNRLKNLPEGVLIEMSEAIYEQSYSAGQMINLEKEADRFSLLLAKTGHIGFHGAQPAVSDGDEYQLYYSRVLVNAGIRSISIEQDTVLLSIDSEMIEHLIFDHTEVANCVLNCVEQFKIAG